MKMTTQHFEHLKSTLTQAQKDSEYSVDDYEKAGMTNIRFGWDLIHLSKLTPWVCRELYPYLNDGHIDTALKRIVI